MFNVAHAQPGMTIAIFGAGGVGLMALLGAVCAGATAIVVDPLEHKRALARELSGFIPVGGILIKSAIAYAGTVVVGEGATFYELHGRHMAKVDAAKVYDEARASAQSFARDMLARIRGNGSS